MTTFNKPTNNFNLTNLKTNEKLEDVGAYNIITEFLDAGVITEEDIKKALIRISLRNHDRIVLDAHINATDAEDDFYNYFEDIVIYNDFSKLSVLLTYSYTLGSALVEYLVSDISEFEVEFLEFDKSLC